jgi:outer membrane protein insertion porin family
LTIVARRGEILHELFQILAVACCLFALSARAVADQQGQQSAATHYVIERIDFVGMRRVESATVRAQISSKPGDPYSPEAVLRDARALRDMKFFDQVRLEVEDSLDEPNGKIVTFYLAERPIIRRIEYKGNRSITEDDILHACKQENVGLSVETYFDQAKVSRAAAAIKDLLAERGYPSASVKISYERIPRTNGVGVLFTVDEGPKAKSP